MKQKNLQGASVAATEFRKQDKARQVARGAQVRKGFSAPLMEKNKKIAREFAGKMAREL